MAAVTVAVVLLTRLRSQPAQVRRRLAVAGVVYLAGALVLESASGLVLRADGARQAYLIVTAIEEFMELAGASLLLATVLSARTGVARTSRTRRPA